MQGHFGLACMGAPVDGLLDVHAAARGLIQDPALRHPVAQGGACGHVSHRGQRSVIGARLGVLLGAPVFSGAVAPFPRGAEGGHTACRRRRYRGRAARGQLRNYLQVGVRARVLLWRVSFAASESQCLDDLVCRVQRRRTGACFAWGRGFCHCCVAVPESRGWGADFPWLVHVLWAPWGVSGGARPLAPRAGVRAFVWALGAPPAASIAMVTPLRGAPEARCSPLPGCLPSVPGSPRVVVECAGVGAQYRPLGLHALWGLPAAGVVGGRPRGGWPATVVRGVWCQALSLPRPLVLRGGQAGFCDPCVPGAVGVGVGTQHRPHSVRPCGPALRAVGAAGGRPRGGCLSLL